MLSAKYKHVITDVLSIAQQKVRRRGKRIEDLRFAKRTMNGYAFFEVGHEVWDMLHEIVEEIHQKYSQYEFAFVVDLCSEVVNTDEEELASLAA